jgi:hypothetical protein
MSTLSTGAATLPRAVGSERSLLLLVDLAYCLQLTILINHPLGRANLSELLEMSI